MICGSLLAVVRVEEETSKNGSVRAVAFQTILLPIPSRNSFCLTEKYMTREISPFYPSVK